MTSTEKDMTSRTYFAEHYELIAQHSFIAKRPVLLRDHEPTQERRCRFCGRVPPEVTFKKIAHAVPEFLGNKAIRSLNECDACNEYLADNYEDHLGRWSLFGRAVSQIKGKAGGQTFKNPNKSLRIEAAESGLNIALSDSTSKESFLKEGGPFELEIPGDATSATYVPIRAAKALVKVACSVCPTSELAQCQKAIDWLMERVSFEVSPFTVLDGFTPGPIGPNAGRVLLLRRKTETVAPYLWSVIQTAGHRFQFFVPGCSADDALFAGVGPKTFAVFHYRIPEFGSIWPYGETRYGRLNWSAAEPVQTSATAVLHIEKALRVENGPENQQV